MVNSVYFVKSTALTPFGGSFQTIEDMFQIYSRSACASLMQKMLSLDKIAGLECTLLGTTNFD